jgi:hypothetical protein
MLKLFNRFALEAHVHPLLHDAESLAIYPIEKGENVYLLTSLKSVSLPNQPPNRQGYCEYFLVVTRETNNIFKK